MPFTDNDIKTAFKEAGLRMDAHGNEIGELGEWCKTLQSQLRQAGQWAAAGMDMRGKEGPGFWPNNAMAEEFGLLVAKCIGKQFREKTMETTTGPLGGFLVPDTLSAWIRDKLQKYGKFRANALTVQVGARQYVPKISTDLTVYAPGEGKSITASDITVKLVKLEPIKLACLTIINRELDEDTIVGLGEIVGMSVTRSIAKKEDEIGFMGDGTSTYFGMTGIIGALRAVDATIGNIQALQVATGNAYSEIVLGDFEGVVGRLDPSADEDAKWYCHKRFYYAVMHALARAAGAADMFQILSPTKTRHFMGYPVEFVASMPYTAANSQICAILGDLKLGAYLGERRALEVARSDDVYFASDQIGFRATERVDLKAHGVGDTTDPESIVALITAAA